MATPSRTSTPNRNSRTSEELERELSGTFKELLKMQESSVTQALLERLVDDLKDIKGFVYSSSFEEIRTFKVIEARGRKVLDEIRITNRLLAFFLLSGRTGFRAPEPAAAAPGDTNLVDATRIESAPGEAAPSQEKTLFAELEDHATKIENLLNHVNDLYTS